jgi:hypothetical protein
MGESPKPGWTAFAWARLVVLAALGLFLELVALQMVFHALSVREYQPSRETVLGVVVPFVAPCAAGALLVISRRRGRDWLSSLRRAAWTLVVVGAFPAFLGALSTLI